VSSCDETKGQDCHLDKIFLRGLVVHTRIGPCDDNPALISLEADLEVSIDLSRAVDSDKLSDTANYSELAHAILDVLIASCHLSIGEAASAAAEAVLSTESKACEVLLTLRDPRVDLKEPVSQIGASVKRCRV
jgi:dihydroneopterin aldolase